MRGGGWLTVALVTLGCAGRQEESPAMAQARELLRKAESPSGDVVLRCEPEDAEVILDGVTRGLCSDFRGAPRGLRVGEGLHQIEVKKEGHWPYTTYIDPHGTRAVLNVLLQPMGSDIPERGTP
ncbi:PEGA domain-containing protein [Hyalangium minutum]|nr:PEGA domain-containing protein [Hyalangium minutum]